VGAACLSLQPLALNALSVPAMAYIIHQMGAAGYAQWTAAVSVTAVLAVLANLGLRAAFVRGLAADPGSAPNALAEQLGLRLALAAAAGALAVIICALVGYPGVVVGCAAVGALGLVLTTAATTLGDLLQSLHCFKTLAAVNVVSGLVLTGFSVLVAWCYGGPVAMAGAYVAGPAASALLLIIIVRRRVCRVSIRWAPSRFPRLLSEARHLAAQQLLFAGSGQAESLLSPRILGMESFGFLAAGAMLGNRLAALPDALCAAAYPTIVQECAKGARAGAGLVLRYLLIATLGGVMVALAGMILATPIGRLLLPSHPELFARVVRVTIWSVPLIGMELVMGYGLNAAGKDAIQARLAVPASLVSLVGSVALVWSLGLPGACWSMLFRPAVRAMFLAPAAIRTFVATTDAANVIVRRVPAAELPLRKAG
jgi:O-antigen/teichoic acid export membrane protein